MSGTLRAWASNFSMYNINVENTHGPGSQAVALSAKGTAGYYGCSFTGYQDTLLSDSGNQTYVKSLVTGVIDFIFGQVSLTRVASKLALNFVVNYPRTYTLNTNALIF